MAIRLRLPLLTVTAILASALSADAQFLRRKTATQVDSILPNDATLAARFGHAMDRDEDVLVIGAPGRTATSGAAYVFARAGTTWDQVARLVPPVQQTGNYFGSSVAVSGDTVVVGAWGEDRPGVGFDVGRAYVYKRNAGTWTLQATFDPQAPLQNGYFGVSVDIQGGLIIVGSWQNDVAVFTRSFNAWSFEGDIIDPTPPPSSLNDADYFGRSVSLEGDTLLISELSSDPTGRVQVYERNGTSWQHQAALVPAIARPGAWVGSTVLLAEGTAFVASQSSASTDPQAVALFERAGTTWTEESSVLGHDTWHNAIPMRDAARDGDLFVVGAGSTSTAGGYVFELVGGRWIETATVRSNPQVADAFTGSSVELDGAEILLGVPGLGEVQIFTLAPADFETFCFGNGGDQMGCTPCPCGQPSDSTLGGCRNSLQSSGLLRAEGDASASGAPLQFFQSGGVIGTFGVLTSGDTTLPNNGPCALLASGLASPLTDGLRCIGGGILRHGVRPIELSGSQNPWSVDLSAFAVGSTRYFATIYRDADTGGCGTGLNTTNGVAVTVAP